MLRLVPNGLREAAAALGAPASVVIRQVCWRAAKAGIVTGILLALARIAGETAPLLFTALNNSFWFNWNLTGGISNLPVTIYAFASAPYDNWQQLAWAGALRARADWAAEGLGLLVAKGWFIRRGQSSPDQELWVREG
jgi:phosphate transport system permease protein